MRKLSLALLVGTMLAATAANAPPQPGASTRSPPVAAPAPSTPTATPAPIAAPSYSAVTASASSSFVALRTATASLRAAQKRMTRTRVGRDTIAKKPNLTAPHGPSNDEPPALLAWLAMKGGRGFL
jgi:hypothetical protein